MKNAIELFCCNNLALLLSCAAVTSTKYMSVCVYMFTVYVFEFCFHDFSHGKFDQKTIAVKFAQEFQEYMQCEFIGFFLFKSVV